MINSKRANAILSMEINALLLAIALLERKGGRKEELEMLKDERKRLIAIAQSEG